MKKINLSKSIRIPALVAAALFAVGVTAKAQTTYTFSTSTNSTSWVGSNGATNWGFASKWPGVTTQTSGLSGTASGATNDIAAFGSTATAGGIVINFGTGTGGAGGGLTLGAIDLLASANKDISVSSSSSAGTLTLNGVSVNSVSNTILSNEGAQSLTLASGSGMSVALGNTTANVIQINGSGGITITTSISGGSKNLNLQGSGTGVLYLQGTNTYTGVTTVSSGILDLGYRASLYNSTTASWTASNIVVNSGATLILDAGGTGEFTTSDVTTLSGLGTATGGFQSGSFLGLNTDVADFSHSGNITNTNSGTNVLGLIKYGGNKLTLSGNNSYSGGTQINAGILSLGSANAIGTAGTISFGGGTLQFSSSNTTDYSARFSAAANQAFSIDTGGQTVTFGTTLTSTGGTLSKSGTGTLTLAASNGYSGGTTVTAGTLVAGNVQAFGTGGVTLNGGTLSLATDTTVNAYNTVVSSTSTIVSNRASTGAGITQTLGTLSIGGQQLNVTAGSNVTSGTAGLTFGATTLTGGATFDTATGTNLTLGAVGGAFAFTKQGTGQMTLNTTSTRTTTAGTTTLTAGTLRLGTANALNTGGAAFTFNGGTLALGVDTGATFNGTNVTVGTGTVTVQVDRANSGAGVTDTLGTLSIGARQLNVTAGSNVTSGTAGLTFGATTLSAAGAVFDTGTGTNVTLGAVGGNFAYTKQGAGQMTLNSTSTRTTAGTTLTAGTLRLGTANALNTGGAAFTFNGGTLALGVDTGATFNGTNVTVGTGTAVTVQVDRANSGVGVTDTLGTLSIGAKQLNVTAGSNVTSGTAGLTFGATTLTGAATFSLGSSTLLTLGAVTNGGFTPIITGSGGFAQAGVISGTGGLTLDSAFTGIATLSQTNTFSGQLTVQRGTLSIASINDASANGALGNSANSVILGSTGGVTGTLQYTGVTATPSSTKTFTMASGGTGAFQIDNSGTTLALSGIIDGSGGLSKTGSGTLQFSGSSVNTYSGLTTVSAGTLNLNKSADGTTAIAGDLTINGGTVSFGTKDEQIANTSAVTLSSGTFDVLSRVETIGSLSMSGGSLNKSTGALTASNASSITGGTVTLSTTTAGIVFGNSLALGGASFVYANAGNPTAASTGVVLNGNVSYAATATAAATFTNTLAGVGRVDLGSATRTFDVADSNALAANTPEVAIGWAVTGSGGIEKTGSGILNLSGANTYQGGTAVSAGELRVTNTTGSGTGSGAVTVTTTGTLLSGTGTISGVVSIGAGAVLSSGIVGTNNGVGTLNTGALTLNDTSDIRFNLSTAGVIGGTINDLVAVTGNLTLDGKLSIGNFGSFGEGRYTLFTYSGSLTNSTLNVISAPSGFTYTVSGTGGSVFLDVLADGGGGPAVPEPSTWIGGGLILGLAGWSQRKRFGKRLAV